MQCTEVNVPAGIIDTLVTPIAIAVKNSPADLLM